MDLKPKAAAIIPTFNEVDVLASCVQSLASASRETILPIVVNAGKPLPSELAAQVLEIPVSDDHFWTASIAVGFARARELRPEYVLLANADTEFLPGSVDLLIEEVAKSPKTIACCPGYERDEDGSIRLLYSDDVMLPFFLHNFLKRRWVRPEEAPSEPYETGVVGGQGVLFRAELLDSFDVDPQSFPHYRGDQDLWLSAKAAGYKLVMVPKAGVINNRAFGMKTLSRKENMARLRYLATSPRARDSWRTIWNLRRKHQPLPVAVVSFLIYTPLVWAYRLLQMARGRTT
jgi:GT2 family glycosyltransferase